MTSSDQLSPMVMGWVGLVGILLSFSDGRSRVGPKTVARLCRDILLTHSFSAILRKQGPKQMSYRCFTATHTLWKTQKKHDEKAVESLLVVCVCAWVRRVVCEFVCVMRVVCVSV